VAEETGFQMTSECAPSAVRERLAVIIVNYRTPDLAIACLNSLISSRSSFGGLEVVIVDGGSADGSAERIAKHIDAGGHKDWVSLLPLSVNGGFAYANNRALMALFAKGDLPDYVALINPDARVVPGALEALCATLERKPQAGAVGAQLVHEDGRHQASAFRFPTIRSEFCRGARTGIVDRVLRQQPLSCDPSQPSEVPWVTGAAVAFRTAALQSAGLFDEGFFLYFEETELMWRLRKAGWRIWHDPAARVVHAGGAATKIRDPETGRPLPQRMPRYWYESRRRYFALVGGRGYALASGGVWLVGHALWRLRRLVFRAPMEGTMRPAADLITHGWWCGRAQVRPAAIAFGDVVPSAPAWMGRGE